MSQDPARSPWPRRLLVGFAALLALDAAMLAAAASIPAVRQQAQHLASTFTGRTGSPRMFALAAAEDSPSYALAYSVGEDGDFRYLVAQRSGKGGDHNWEMSGTFNDDRMSYLRTEPGAFAWFGDDEAEYIVRDAALVAEALRISLPVRELGAEMGRIGGQQGLIGAKQGRLGSKQGAIGARIGALAARSAAAAMAGDDRQAERINAELEAARRELEQQSLELERQMRPLGAEQARLERIQQELGRRQQRLVETETVKMRELFERAKREGKAVRLHAEA